MTPDEQAQLDIISQAALSTRPTLYFTFDVAERCILEGISGDFVECGVYAGAQCAAMALACQKYKDPRKIHLFDSFKGIPHAGPHDTEQPGIGPCKDGCGELVSTGVASCSLEAVKDNMAHWGISSERFVYHKGWFQNTIPQLQNEPIAILRLDGDLYESTMICLLGLFPALIAGGFCIIDDYALTGCRLACQEYFGQYHVPDIYPIEGGEGPIWFRKTI